MSASLTLRLDDEQQRRQVNPRIKTVFVVIISFMSSDVKKGQRLEYKPIVTCPCEGTITVCRGWMDVW